MTPSGSPRCHLSARLVIKFSGSRWPGVRVAAVEEAQMALGQDAKFVERYRRLHDITLRVISELTPNGIEILPLLALSGSSVPLGIGEVVSLMSEAESRHKRDHLVQVHLASLESRLYRSGYCVSGHMIRILAGNYRVAAEDVKDEIVLSGFSFTVATVSNEQELREATPLRSVSDAEYSAKYERLIASWGSPRQQEASRLMSSRLKSIHGVLPEKKIGGNFRRERRGREEPLPMYVRNEIHHPTKGSLLDTEEFQRDKRIGYAIMAVWLSEDGRPVV